MKIYIASTLALHIAAAGAAEAAQHSVLVLSDNHNNHDGHLNPIRHLAQVTWCDDHPEYRFKDKNKKNCDWVKNNNKCNKWDRVTKIKPNVMCPESCGTCAKVDAMCPCYDYADLMGAVDRIKKDNTVTGTYECDSSSKFMGIRYFEAGQEYWPTSYGTHHVSSGRSSCNEGDALITVKKYQLKACKAMISNACTRRNN